MIKETKGVITSRFDSLPIDYLIIAPEQPKAVVMLLHGMCEHKERYVDFMRFLAENGYASIIHDHRGHGESVKSHDDHGFFYSGGYNAMIKDVDSINRLIREEYPALKLFMFGHSMGSMVARSYLKRFPENIDGLIVCGSPSYNTGALLGKYFVCCLALFKGWRYRSPLVWKMALGGYVKPFADAVSPNAWICSDKHIVNQYDANPKCNFIFTLNGFYNLFSLMLDTYSRKGWTMRRPSLPIHFISGENDPCAISPAYFAKAVDFIRKRGYANVTSKMYHGMRHEILNEKDKQLVYNDLLDLINNWNKQ